MNIDERSTCRQSRPHQLLRQELVARSFDMSKEIKHFQFLSTCLTKGRTKSFDMLPKTATCRTATFDMLKQRSTCCFNMSNSTCCRCGRGFNESRDDGLTVARSVAIEFHFQIRSTREDWKQHTHGQITKTWTIIMPTLVHNTAQNTDCRPRKVFESGGSNWGDDERGRLPPLQGRRPCWGWIRKAGCPSNNGDSGVLPPENCGNYMCIMGHFVLHDAENRMIVSSFVWTKHRYVAEGRTDVQTELL